MGAEVWRPNLSTSPLPNMRTGKHKLDSSWKHQKTKMNDILTCYILEVLSFLRFMHVHVWDVCMCTQYMRLCIHLCPYLWKPDLLSSFIIFHVLFFLDTYSPRESGASLPFRFDRQASKPRDTPVLTPCSSWTAEDCLHTWPHKGSGEATSCLHTCTASSSLLPASRVLGDL